MKVSEITYIVAFLLHREVVHGDLAFPKYSTSDAVIYYTI